MALFKPNLPGERRGMIKTIERLSREFTRRAGQPPIDPRVLQVMSEVPRHLYVPPACRRSAYADQPLSIGHGQTISQPYIVALMSTLGEIAPEDRVLEVGTGSGYQTAVLARLAREVFTVEVVAELAERARVTLGSQGITNVQASVGDGHLGLPQHAPFDAILVTAAPDAVPPALAEQLAPGGRLVIPVGDVDQVLHVITRGVDGSFSDRIITAVRFVPLVPG